MPVNVNDIEPDEKIVEIEMERLREDDAVISMVDSNLYRDMILPSEKAFAYKMKYDAMRRHAAYFLPPVFEDTHGSRPMFWHMKIKLPKYIDRVQITEYNMFKP